MPIMDVRYPAGALDKAAKAALAQRLTDDLVAMEGGANTHGGRAFAWVLFNEIADGDWWVGGQTGEAFVAPPGRFLVHVTIPEGYMNAAHKTQVHQMVTAAILEVTGHGAAAEGGSIQVILDEVSEGDWGAGGRTISLDSIADSVGLPKDGERFTWVKAYFAAKARQYAAAGYPADAAGLLPALATPKP